VVHELSKDHTVFTFRAKQSKKKALAQCHSATSNMTGIFNFSNFRVCEHAFRSKQFRKKFFLDSLTLAAEDTTILQYVGNHAQNNISSHYRRSEFSSFKFV